MNAMKVWLRFFRVVNVPTVPGDVFVGLAAALVAAGRLSVPTLPVVAASLAAVCLYLFGLADNDIVGAPTDVARPIPEGRISLTAARLARGLCLFAALVVGAACNLPPAWWIIAFATAVAVVVYNRTKSAFLMGLCRGLDVAAGAALVPAVLLDVRVLAAVLVWTLYVTFVTRYSEGEEGDPARKRRVGFLVGALVYLQLVALMVFLVKPLLVAGAVLLVVLRLMRRALPEVSAS